MFSDIEQKVSRRASRLQPGSSRVLVSEHRKLEYVPTLIRGLRDRPTCFECDWTQRLRWRSEAQFLRNADCDLDGIETLSAHIPKFNLASAELSANTGVSVIDVQTIMARHGTDALKCNAIHLKPEGRKLAAQEPVRVCNHIGLSEDGRD